MATTDKYDRQLRLWGAAGQRALGSTMVVLLGSSACGTETLKNLVLPGVGSFMVVDDGDEVSPSEAANQEVQKCPVELSPSMVKFGEHSSNFFLPPSSKAGGGVKPPGGPGDTGVVIGVDAGGVGFSGDRRSVEANDR